MPQVRAQRAGANLGHTQRARDYLETSKLELPLILRVVRAVIHRRGRAEDARLR